MSGIVAVLRTDGAAVEPSILETLTGALRHRGPDSSSTWCEGPVGLGHTELRTTSDVAPARQPFSIDGRVQIVADGRIDARPDLIQKLSRESLVPAGASDVELILRAYLRWGDACVQHLLGDFSFAIWDGPARRLFCARDHMGVKPFYYAHVGRWLLVSSAIDALHLHPEISSELNELAIADFLIFGSNQDSATTSFRDIRRLPPAHTLTWSGQAVSVHRYWSMPIDEPVYYRRDADYVDEFKAIVRQAVEDRLRVPQVGVFMSGGLDSPLLAATARDVLANGAVSDPVRAFTFVYASLFDDPEREQSTLVAHHLGIPIRHYALDQQPGWLPSACAQLPEPSVALADPAVERQCYRDAAQHSRVAFYGEGPDNALGYEWRAHLGQLWRTRRLGRLARDVMKHVAHHKRVPLVPGIPRMIRGLRVRKQMQPEFPPWLAPDLVNRLHLRDRWQAKFADPVFTHPWRPRSYASLHLPHWQDLFERLEPATTGAPLEVRHPFVDVRVLRCMLHMPAMPWCRSKYLLRSALRRVVPERVRTRAKTPLAGDAMRERIRRYGLPEFRPSALSRRFGNEAQLGPVETAWSAHAALQFVALSHWFDRGTSQPWTRQEERKEHGPKAATNA